MLECCTIKYTWVSILLMLCCTAETIRRLEGFVGVDAALLLLEEMKTGVHGLDAAPDVFTYTTIMVGIARAMVSMANRTMTLTFSRI